MYEIDEAAKAITEAADSDANIIFGAIIDEAMSGEIKITVIATGFDTDRIKENRPSLGGFHRPAPVQQSPMMNSFSIQPPAPTPMPQMPEEEAVDEELDVPAFIRRKLK